MKKNILKSLTVIITISLLALTSCEKNSAGATDNLTAPFLLASADGISTILEDNMLRSLILTADLTPEELEILISMREEEKVARDVYAALARKWDHPVFSRISAAENTHLTAVNSLLKFYATADTIVSDPGVFNDEEVQKLYDELVAKGSATIEDAFKTGALVEEMDIKDLREAIPQTTNENIIMVLSNLERGSRNHLRAFNRQITIRGFTYTPVHIQQEEYDSIVNTPVEAGNRYRMNPGRPCRFVK